MVLVNHGGSVTRALMELFPDVCFDKNITLNKAAQRRKFFENYATVRAFDPLIPENWYNHKDDVMNFPVLYFLFFFFH
jgi:hypothetical protein